MARILKPPTTVTEHEFETLLLVLTRSPSGSLAVHGYLKSPKTGLPDVQLFGTEDDLGALVDDLGEALDVVKAAKEGKNDEENDEENDDKADKVTDR